MSLIGNSGQKVGDGSTAIQAGGDVSLGNTTTEIVTICELVVSSKMSSLKEEAMMIAMERAHEFGTKVALNLSNKLDEKIESKLRDPDIQYAISQAVMQVATKGISEKNDLLQELIISKINNEDEDSDLLIDLALETAKRTTSSELKLLGLIFYFRKCTKAFHGVDITTLVQSDDDTVSIDGITKDTCWKIFNSVYTNPNIDFDRITSGTDSIKRVDIDIMSLKGLTLSDKHFRTSYFDLLEKRTGTKLSNSQIEFEKSFPELSYILNCFGINTLEEFNSIALSALGDVIAKDYLKARKFL
ncbi:LPO_1073/Vpar_1526 family protein [Leclercia adecarboxylata]|uniref:LPO_1073/Vpar_1526 family protein n=1 Tax=Leclercia adecarboxylata TaxID=83655 RepID=UPI0013FE493C|nr:LPO_1073/Vpar_1526 family protein [Leclercia adecarboxylata]QIM43949.1 hypothetical protein G7098_14865 [Leclercia adecarboxylata]